MKFKPELSTAVLERQLLDRDFSAAWEAGRVRLGESCLFFPKFSGTTYLPYSQIVNAYLRQEEVNANLCCGRANFDQFFLMVRGTDGQLRRGQVLSKEKGKEALALLAAANPAIEIGYHP